jgi:hypothetical protein
MFAIAYCSCRIATSARDRDWSPVSHTVKTHTISLKKTMAANEHEEKETIALTKESQSH